MVETLTFDRIIRFTSLTPLDISASRDEFKSAKNILVGAIFHFCPVPFLSCPICGHSISAAKMYQKCFFAHFGSKLDPRIVQMKQCYKPYGMIRECMTIFRLKCCTVNFFQKFQSQSTFSNLYRLMYRQSKNGYKLYHHVSTKTLSN